MSRAIVKGVFISYSRVDTQIVTLAAKLLRAGGATVFQDVVDIAYGDKWQTVLLAAIQKCERVMVFWSAAAAASEWVEREWRAALESGKRIVPMLLDRTPLPTQLTQFNGMPDLMDILNLARLHSLNSIGSIAQIEAAATVPAKPLAASTRRCQAGHAMAPDWTRCPYCDAAHKRGGKPFWERLSGLVGGRSRWSAKPLPTSTRRCEAGHPMSLEWITCPYCEAARGAGERTRVNDDNAPEFGPSVGSARPRGAGVTRINDPEPDIRTGARAPRPGQRETRTGVLKDSKTRRATRIDAFGEEPVVTESYAEQMGQRFADILFR